MMITALIFELMFCRFEDAMGFLCNRETTKQVRKNMVSLAHDILMTDLR